MLECDGQIPCCRRRVWLRHDSDVIALHGLHEAFRHAVALWAAHWRGQRLQAEQRCKLACLVRRIARAVVAQPLDSDSVCSAFPNRFSPAASITSRTMSPLWPAVVAANSSLRGRSSRARTSPATARRCRSETRSRRNTTAGCYVPPRPCHRDGAAVEPEPLCVASAGQPRVNAKRVYRVRRSHATNAASSGT